MCQRTSIRPTLKVVQILEAKAEEVVVVNRIKRVRAVADEEVAAAMAYPMV